VFSKHSAWTLQLPKESIKCFLILCRFKIKVASDAEDDFSYIAYPEYYPEYRSAMEETRKEKKKGQNYGQN
jgi:hypothetical protein